MKYYAGVGSRNTPYEVMKQMFQMARDLAGLGYTLRSGAAAGADSAFEGGAKKADGKREIYLPWNGYNNRNWKETKGNLEVMHQVSLKAEEIASYHHPKWYEMTDGVQKLIARNTYQILGYDCKTPSKFVVCWTKEARGWGGTGQAIRIARLWNIPVFDLAIKRSYQEALDYAASL